MNLIATKIRDKHALWYKALVFIACVAICAYLLPKQGPWQTAHVKVGDLWSDDDLISSLDFLVQKTSAELRSDKTPTDSLYYRKQDVSIDDVLSKLPDHLAVDKRKLKSYLDSLYTIGVYFPTSPFSDSLLYIVNNHDVSLVRKKDLLDKKDIKQVLIQHRMDTVLVNTILHNLKPNIVYDETLSHEINEANHNIKAIYKSKIHKGEVLIRKNDVVTPEQINMINNYTVELITQEKSKSTLAVHIGHVLTCCLILGIMMLFLAFFRKVIFSQNSHVTFIFLIITLIVIVSSIVNKYNPGYISAIPYCLIPILIRVFFDSRTALFSFLNIVLLCSFFTTDKFEFVFIQLITGIGTIFSVADMGKRSKLFVSSVLIFLFYALSFIAYHLVNSTANMIGHFQNYIPYLISSLCVLFAFPLIFLFEKLFGFTSDFTLLELCDLNAPILRQLSQKIPGTFQHSLQVANLAEEACYKIGGNALLVRAGAMYHDIGKMDNPRFFTENQVGEISPHEDLSPEESAQIIIGHVIKGIEKAKQHKIPETIIDFIRTHHGTTATRYFLHHYKKEHEGERINEDLFRYPGPIPFSKETAILMMADGVEASSRSLKKYDAIAIDELVDNIINHQIAENQFLNADITFRDINHIKKIFKKRLMNIYHVRIEYPR